MQAENGRISTGSQQRKCSGKEGEAGGKYDKLMALEYFCDGTYPTFSYSHL